MKAKILLAGLLFMIALCLAYFPGHAQDTSCTVDSMLRDTASRIPNPPATPVSGTSLTQVLTVVIPSILGALLTILGAIQYVLKRIPTQQSVRIQGTLGKVADAITFLQKDANLFGGTHKILIALVISAALVMPARAQTAAIPKTDSISKAWGIGLNATPAGFTFDGVYHIGAGTSVCYQVKDYNYGTQKTTVKRSFNFIWVPLVTGQPITSIKNFAMIGATYGFDNNLIQVGPFFYTPGLKLRNQIGIMGIIGLNL